MSKPINISASRGAGVLGLSDYGTQVEVWSDIVHDLYPSYFGDRYQEREKTAAMAWGSGFETAIINAIDKGITGRETLYTSDNRIITCHIDGMYPDGTLHEGKTSSLWGYKDRFGEPGSDRIPRDYQIQVQQQMMLTRADRCILSILVFPNRVEDFPVDIDDLSENEKFKWVLALCRMGYFHQYIIPANPVLHEALRENYLHWWKAYIDPEICTPEPNSYEDIKLLTPSPVGTIVADEATERRSATYKQALAEIKELSDTKDRCKTDMLAYMAKQEVMALDEDSTDKWILKSRWGRKLHSYNGRTFR